MKAKEMFEELGYKIDAKSEEIVYYKIDELIEFQLLTKHLVSYDNDSEYHYYSIHLLRAITQQMKELGWLDA